MRVLLIVFTLFFIRTSFAQTNRADVVLHQDIRLDSLDKALKPIIESKPKSEYQRLVYRLMIDSIQSREYAYRLKEKFVNAYQHKHEVYISYSYPFFKVKLGDFLSKDSADYFRYKLIKKFKLNPIVAPDIQQLISIM